MTDTTKIIHLVPGMKLGLFDDDSNQATYFDVKQSENGLYLEIEEGFGQNILIDKNGEWTDTKKKEG